MYIKNPLNFVEWDTKSFLSVLFSIHIAMLGVIGLDLINFQIPILRQFIGFIYLTFVPGVLLLRLLRLKQISFIEKSMFTISLSLITLMLSGFFITEIGTFFVEKPLSTIPLFCMIFLVVSTLFIICYIREKNTIYNPSFITLNYNISRLMIYLLLILFLTLFGTYLVNYYHSNILLLFATLLITSSIFLVLFDKFIPETMYPMVIFILSISLLYHNSLISSTLYGFDIHQEYYASNVVKILGTWNPEIPTNINAMLSIVMLAPIYSNICDISLTYVFKIVYPFLFSFTPLGMYLIYKKQINNPKIAFFSIFYFMSVYPYYTEMLALARQEIAELFLVLIILVMISNYEAPKKKILYIIFSCGLVLSHYGLSYLFIILSLIGYMFLVYLNKKSEIFCPRTIFLFIMCAIGWSIYISSGSIFDTVGNLFVTVYHGISYLQTSAVSLVTKGTSSFSGNLIRLSYYSSIFLILIGFMQSLIAYKNSKTRSEIQFSKEYISFSFASICSLIVFLITSATGMNIYRIFHISMIFLSLYCILGGLSLIDFIGKAIKNIVPTFHTTNNFKLLSIFLALFMLLNIGFVQEMLNDYPTSVSLSQESLKKGGANSSMLLYRYYIPIQDVYGSMWLSKNRNATMDIYADETAARFVLTSYGMMPNQKYLFNEENENDYFNSYIYFRYPNVIYNLISKKDSDMYDYESISELSSITNHKYIIYSSGYNTVYT